MHTIAGIAVALKEANSEEFLHYQKQVNLFLFRLLKISKPHAKKFWKMGIMLFLEVLTIIYFYLT